MEFLPGNTVGIDLGTTFSALAQVNDEGEPVPIQNEDGDIETASLILLTENKHVVIGPNRSRAAMEDPENVVERIKRRMGDIAYKRTFDGHEITPEFISSLILRKLKQDGERILGPIANAVITVPYYFNDSRRKATQDAGKIAGLNVIDIINEPTAAALTYAWHRGELGYEMPDKKSRRVLIYDLGGGTFDSTLVEYNGNHFRAIATDGDVKLGGVDWSDRLANYVCEKFQEKFGTDPSLSAQAIQILRNDCDTAKIALTTKPSTNITCRYEGHRLSVPVTRELFEDLTKDLLQRTCDTAAAVLEQAGMKFAQLDAIVLVGGSTLMPQVSEMLEKLTGVKPYVNPALDPHTAVARGAAIHAAILEAKYNPNQRLTDRVQKLLKNIHQEDVNSHALGVVATDPAKNCVVNNIMIPKNTPLPFSLTRTFKTNKENQERISIQVLEGDAPDPKACSLLGRCRITDLPPNLPKGTLVEVTYAFDKAGRISVSAREKAGGHEAKINIERKGTLTDNQINDFTLRAEEYSIE
ncbi:MAG: Hsp70 family protein [Thermoguttaceae bacterium]|jgi:molecular chaperone DnaK